MASPPPVKNPNVSTRRHICFLFLVCTATLSAAVSTSSYSSVCPSVAPASDRHTDADDELSLASSFQIYDGYFSGGADSLFSSDDQLHNSYRSFSLFPDRAIRTSDPALVHLNATLTLTGPRSSKYLSHGRRRNHTFAQSISFVLDGYYSSASHQLCMVGTGVEPAANGSVKQNADVVVLRLHVPSPSSLTEPFVTGTLDGSSDLGAIQLLAYAEGDDYRYGERASCSPPVQPAMGSLRALWDNLACEDLKDQLMTSYRLLDHRHGGAPAKLRRMHVNRMQCTADGAVRAYMVFSNDTGSGRRGYRHHYHFMVNEEAVVADGHWDSARRVLCLRACRVVRSVPSTLAVRECGIEMSLWFPAVWTVLERSLVAGVLWSSGQSQRRTTAGPISGVVSAFSFDDQRRNLSDVTYNYNDTMLEVAKKHYHLTKINKEENMIKGSSFPVPGNYHDFRLEFFVSNGGSGDASPVTFGSVVLTEDGLATDADSFSRPAAAVDDLLSVSYDILHHYYASPAKNWVDNVSRSNYSLEEGRIAAEGVYDPRRGILSMVGCQERNGSMDCRILITVQFAALGDRAQGMVSRGTISSLRDRRTDRLFFEEMDIALYGMYSEELSEAISRMDLESVMLVASTTLSCVFTVLQILHTRRNPETAPAMSITMLGILALGHLAPLARGFEVMFLSRRSQYSLYSTTDGWPELNQVMIRAPALIAFLLQLRLLQLALFGRLRPAGAGHQSEPTATAPSTAVSERTVLQVCLPPYLLGGVVATIVHVINTRAAASGGSVPVRGEPAATLWDDLASYAGLILDGFLLPQVILNLNASVSAAGSGGAPAISPWFYVGGTVIRAAPHVYDAVRARMYGEPGVMTRLSSYVYASPRGDLFGVAWDVVVPCGAALLASLLFLQQRRLGDAWLLPSQRRSGGYEMVSHN